MNISMSKRRYIIEYIMMYPQVNQFKIQFVRWFFSLGNLMTVVCWWMATNLKTPRNSFPCYFISAFSSLVRSGLTFHGTLNGTGTSRRKKGFSESLTRVIKFGPVGKSRTRWIFLYDWYSERGYIGLGILLLGWSAC